MSVEELSRQLQIAVDKMRLADVESLLLQGADPNWADPAGWTSLHTACALLGSINIQNVFELDLVLGIFKALILAGGSLNKFNMLGNTPLHLVKYYLGLFRDDGKPKTLQKEIYKKIEGAPSLLFAPRPNRRKAIKATKEGRK